MTGQGDPGEQEEELTQPSGVPLSVLQVQVGDKIYPMYSRPSCRTCQSRYRHDIEHKILSGHSYHWIADWVRLQTQAPDPDDRIPDDRLPPPSVNALRSHAKNHMPMTASARRALIDARTQEIGEGLAEGAQAAADHIALGRLIVAVGMEGLADGTLKPDMSDVMSAAKLLAVHDVKDDGGADLAAWRDALMTYMEIAKTFVPPEHWRAFGAALSEHPRLRAMTATPTLALTAPDSEDRNR